MFVANSLHNYNVHMEHLLIAFHAHRIHIPNACWSQWDASIENVRKNSVLTFAPLI